MEHPENCPVGGLCNDMSGYGSAKALLLIPAGRFRARDGRPADVPAWSLTREAALAVIDRFDSKGKPLVIDYEHQTLAAERNGKSVPAAGWIDRLQWREDEGLYGVDPRWTSAALEFIKADEYRYLSPVFHYSQSTGVVQELLHAALTNVPALDGFEPGLQAAARREVHHPLTAIERDVCRKMGTSEADFVRAKAKELQEAVLRSGHPGPSLGLTKVEAEICQQMGTEPQAYLRAKAQASMGAAR